MKKIWEESFGCGIFVSRWWSPGKAIGFGTYEESHVREHEYYIGAVVRAWWDRKTRTLRVELLATGYEADWMLEKETILETCSSREVAYRFVVKAADVWRDRVEASIPAPDMRTDEQIKADFESSRDNALLASGVEQ